MAIRGHIAETIAAELCEKLESACSEIVIAGSIRRGKETVKDIELVACLHEDRPLRLAESALDAAILRLIQGGYLAFDTDVKRAGPRYKRFVLTEQTMIEGSGEKPVVELFIAERANFGNILAIRTGDATFTKMMVTSVEWSGLMPYGLKQEKGFLIRNEETAPQNAPWDFTHGERIPCPTEESFFAALGLPTLPPEQRDLAGIAKLRELIRREDAGE